MRLVLASSSPRRRELLTAAGFEFDVEPADIDERVRPDETPEAYVERMAIEKAGAVQPRFPDRTVLAADTIVIVDGDILGKPGDADTAIKMLSRLEGREHEVMTAVAVWWPGDDAPEVIVELTRVWMRDITQREIADVVATGEPLDRAGAYAIQGLASRWITRIDGAYGTVVGLPVEAVDRLLRSRATEAYPTQ
jgi:septum formation protein